jgi:class 3 adenylate cyclase
MEISYHPPAPLGLPKKRLITEARANESSSFVFYDRIEIGRLKENRQLPGVLLIQDATVSSRHCIVTQEADGRCFVRDVSRNGTRLDGRRLSPNLKTEVKIGQRLSVGKEMTLILDGDQPLGESADLQDDEFVSGTLGVSELTTVTVLVGDIRNYTELVREVDSNELQDSVNRVFDRLEREVEALGGTLKEFQGDAIFAFWECNDLGCHAVDACTAALHLKELTRKLARDRSVWTVEQRHLKMDFALATGPVNISGYGKEGALGLSMVGESVVLAYRIEKFADDSTGSIVVCPLTRQLADGHFKFKNLGSRKSKGFDEAHDLYSLVS